MKIRKLLLLALTLALPVGLFAADAAPTPQDPGAANPPVASPKPEDPPPAEPPPAEPAPPAPPAEPPPAPPAPPAPAAKALSWVEVTTFAPGLCNYDDAFKARMKATCKLKLRYLRRQCNFIAMVNPDASIRAKAKQIAEDAKALIG